MQTPQKSSKKVFLETFGCQMNVNDSERLLGFLSDLSYSRTAEAQEADLIIINTCSVRDRAEQKVYSTLGRFKELKRANPGLLIGVSGCVAQQKGALLTKRAPYIDMVIGTSNIHRIKSLLKEAAGKKGGVVATSLTDGIEKDEFSRRVQKDPYRAFVSIMRGCDNYCSYCIVPYTRGPEVSRSADDILEEIRVLGAGQTKEVTLLGQNVNSYRGDKGLNFTGLLKKVSQIENIERVRFVTSHPKDISEELIYLFGEEPKLCRHLHLPVQSGSDRILRRMKRGYTVEGYLEKIELFKKLYKDIAITTDIIVGFPGEDEKDFEETMLLVKRARFDNIFSFIYSPRPGTLAAGFNGAVAREKKLERLRALQETQRAITLEGGRSFVGKTIDVLVDGISKRDNHEVAGRTQTNRVVNFRAPHELRGSIVDVTVTEAYQNSLRGVYSERRL
ncbi:MAG: tRNA (N6-isopentenyl adenosine(37)-C2)-methylthiotransferase MiaB [Thermodesulfobacteriota bacterium]